MMTPSPQTIKITSFSFSVKLKFCALASGSSGNCFFVKEGDNAILIDAGISARQVCIRLHEIRQKPESIKGIFVTHEHIDHIRGIDILSTKYNIPVYITKKTAEAAFICRDERLINTIKDDEELEVSGVRVSAFKKSHDTREPVSYSIEVGDKILSIITDIGYACKNVIESVKNSDSLILESNHDVNMLMNGPYPSHLKRRIVSDKGHLSNYDAALLVLEHGSGRLNELVLSHLSAINNTPELALRTFGSIIRERKDLNAVNICVSERHKPTKMFKV